MAGTTKSVYRPRRPSRWRVATTDHASAEPLTDQTLGLPPIGDRGGRASTSASRASASAAIGASGWPKIDVATTARARRARGFPGRPR